jgi:hypothetical protein
MARCGGNGLNTGRCRAILGLLSGKVTKFLLFDRLAAESR